ncbi:hypothetical protein ACORG1_06630 [Mycobacterium sp. TJFP1]|jgi:hypothetical protein|uniref:Secreted protein n=2 Tax=Mycolicibacterium vanbaalenii TaxID=110539 RepID=A1T4K7_MYCVP|nr:MULTISPECIES: hypothetical protein [Mycolicibacterium]ABM12107.1 hypothetical protein Mvan_1273 [Mycolicibacterium vanbaalenii PYR-1]MDW5614500.1 hypothetical protein [Mycolicibacterium sp. D5.8-2]QZT58047.1 hypothetical protein JN084_05430 [Mycolicibacterium austroafricanum]UJL31118.1 hypothetical protein HZU38_12335 [Mycolicibacterium vanbaalenii]WND57952.1 hypothetical protein QQA43_05935 [Mycolicibacterium vanbaalenii]
MRQRLRWLLAGLGAAVIMAAPASAAPPGGDDASGDIDAYPLAEGDYTTPDDYGWVFFTTPDGRACGIGPNGGPVGCDAVAADAPPGVNQTWVMSWGPAEYRYSDTASFTRGVDMLPVGERVESLGGACAVTSPDTVRCETYGNHGFILSADQGVFW